MQQRQLRLGDILDDYCPRERRVTNHAVVAMIGEDVKQTRCTTCDADHEYKHAKIPRQRRKTETPAVLYSQVAAGAPKRVAHEPHPDDVPQNAEAVAEDPQHEPFVDGEGTEMPDETNAADAVAAAAVDEASGADGEEPDDGQDVFVHRPLIRAQLPRHEGQAPPQRQAPDFTIRQPAGRPGRFRPRNQRGGQPSFGGNGNRAGGHGNTSGNYGQSTRGGGMPRQHGGRPQDGNSPFRSGRNPGAGAGRKRSK